MNGRRASDFLSFNHLIKQRNYRAREAGSIPIWTSNHSGETYRDGYAALKRRKSPGFGQFYRNSPVSDISDLGPKYARMPHSLWSEFSSDSFVLLWSGDWRMRIVFVGKPIEGTFAGDRPRQLTTRLRTSMAIQKRSSTIIKSRASLLNYGKYSSLDCRQFFHGVVVCLRGCHRRHSLSPTHPTWLLSRGSFPRLTAAFRIGNERPKT